MSWAGLDHPLGANVQSARFEAYRSS
jgi:hypothetical protein